MANTYTQIYIHLVFSVKHRESVLTPESFRLELMHYLSAAISKRGNRVIAINAVEDHVHILLGMSPMECLAKLVQSIKRDSTNWIIARSHNRGRFAWQRGYGAFSYSHSQIAQVKRYIDNQAEHHKRRTFKDEYLCILQNFGVDFEDQYVTDID